MGDLHLGACEESSRTDGQRAGRRSKEKRRNEAKVEMEKPPIPPGPCISPIRPMARSPGRGGEVRPTLPDGVHTNRSKRSQSPDGKTRAAQGLATLTSRSERSQSQGGQGRMRDSRVLSSWIDRTEPPSRRDGRSAAMEQAGMFSPAKRDPAPRPCGWPLPTRIGETSVIESNHC
jgi:hypothetical protein